MISSKLIKGFSLLLILVFMIGIFICYILYHVLLNRGWEYEKW